MFSTLANAWHVKDIRSRILFTIAMLFVFRAGSHIPVPGINTTIIKQMINSGQLLGFFDVISGGSFSNFTIFALSITPYVTSSIIVQLLTIAIPSWEEMAKSGDDGRKRLAQYTRYGTVLLAFIQAISMTYGLRNAVNEVNLFNMLLIAFTLTAGTAFLMWLGEQINDKGIGNGISMIIFAGIVSRIPSMFVTTYQYVKAGTTSIFGAAIFWLVILFMIAAIVYVSEGQRRIPIQYARRQVGRRMYGGQSTHLPLMVNPTGMIPIIFAVSILQFPLQIAAFFPKGGYAHFMNTWFNTGGVLYNVLDVILIIFFTFFYSAVVFNPEDVADNLKKYGGFIPGIRPGKPTSDYITKIMNRLVMIGGIFLALVTLVPTIIMKVTGLNLYFSGSAILIAVGVALDTVKQLESQLVMRNYQGFLK